MHCHPTLKLFKRCLSLQYKNGRIVSWTKKTSRARLKGEIEEMMGKVLNDKWLELKGKLGLLRGIAIGTAKDAINDAVEDIKKI
ncbi:hypothetical protein MJC1_04198 [Methylocystis sp. MJC1]|nr:hypothetical protein MJC1_04198 [Methylocystis sp. MJC1]